MWDAGGIAEGIRAGAPEILDSWRKALGLSNEGSEARLVEEVERILAVFAEFCAARRRSRRSAGEARRGRW